MIDTEKKYLSCSSGAGRRCEKDFEKTGKIRMKEELPLFESMPWVNPVLMIERRDGSKIKIELICFEAIKENRQGCDKVAAPSEEEARPWAAV